MPTLDSLSLWQDEALSLLRRTAAAPAGYEGLRALELEFSSRGDRVAARVMLPDGPGPHPVVILQHGLGASREAEYLAMGARWVREGVAVATIDLPLHGVRASAKMSERLIASASDLMAGRPLARVDGMLWSEFARQTTHDLRRCHDALEATPETDAKRVVFVGFSLGAMAGTLYCANDPRPRAAVLALAGATGAGVLDPAQWVGAIAPRPILFVNATRDETIPLAASERLFRSAGAAPRVEWFDAGHGDLPGAALKSIWHFVRTQLGIA